MSAIEAYYQANIRTNSDINEHLPTLRMFADECAHVTEFGVRWGSSTAAFLSSKAFLVSYDIVHHPAAVKLFEVAHEEGKDAKFLLANTLQLEDIEPTDLLFIDTLHNYHQLINELNKFHVRVKKYIIMHDTVTYGNIGEGGGPGLLKAIQEFLNENKQWFIFREYNNNNGLMVLKKSQE